MLRLRLFGGFAINGPDGRIDRRSELTGLLWGSHFEEQARQNFRQALAGGERTEVQARASWRQTLSELRADIADAAPDPLLAGTEAIAWITSTALVDTCALEDFQ